MPDHDAMTTEARGRCACGRVRFVARFPSRFNAHCHCESCRRAHGAAFVTWAGETHVTLVAFDDSVDRPPTSHAFADEHVPWLPFERPRP